MEYKILKCSFIINTSNFGHFISWRAGKDFEVSIFDNGRWNVSEIRLCFKFRKNGKILSDGGYLNSCVASNDIWEKQFLFLDMVRHKACSWLRLCQTRTSLSICQHIKLTDRVPFPGLTFPKTAIFKHRKETTESALLKRHGGQEFMTKTEKR